MDELSDNYLISGTFESPIEKNVISDRISRPFGFVEMNVYTQKRGCFNKGCSTVRFAGPKKT